MQQGSSAPRAHRLSTDPYERMTPVRTMRSAKALEQLNQEFRRIKSRHFTTLTKELYTHHPYSERVFATHLFR